MTTSQHLTEEDAGELTWYQPGSHANLTALRENVSRLVTSVIYGAKSCEFWGKRNPDGSWEKTSQDCLALNLEDSLGEWSMTWPKWGLVSDGVCMELATLGLSTGETACSSLPTPTASDGTTGAIIGANDQFIQLASGALRKINQNGTDGSLGLARTMMMLPTPTASQDHKPVRQLIPSEADGTHGTMLVGAIGNELGVETGAGAVLNPQFVSWMMMLPEGWLDLSELLD